MSEIKFEKLEHIATLAETSGGYTLEVNLVSWNDKEAKVDIRRWDPQGNPKKGIALSTSMCGRSGGRRITEIHTKTTQCESTEDEAFSRGSD